MFLPQKNGLSFYCHSLGSLTQLLFSCEAHIFQSSTFMVVVLPVHDTDCEHTVVDVELYTVESAKSKRRTIR